MKAEKRNPYRRKNFLIPLVTGALLLLIVIFVVLNMGNPGAADDRLLITRSETVLLEIPLKDLRQMAAGEVWADIASSGSGNESGVFTGLPIEQILDLADPAWSDACQGITLKAADGYTAFLSADEILAGKNVWVVCAKDGEALTSWKAGGDGPLRVLILSDDFGNRSAKCLTEIRIRP